VSHLQRLMLTLASLALASCGPAPPSGVSDLPTGDEGAVRGGIVLDHEVARLDPKWVTYEEQAGWGDGNNLDDTALVWVVWAGGDVVRHSFAQPGVFVYEAYIDGNYEICLGLQRDAISDAPASGKWDCDLLDGEPKTGVRLVEFRRDPRSLDALVTRDDRIFNRDAKCLTDSAHFAELPTLQEACYDVDSGVLLSAEWLAPMVDGTYRDASIMVTDLGTGVVQENFERPSLD
jgi:hypothetical protein